MKFLANCSLSKAFTFCPNALYADFLREFWSTAEVYDTNPPLPKASKTSTSTPEDKPLRPLKDFAIKFTVLNGSRPLTLDFDTFVIATGLDYAKGEYVKHPTTNVVKAELAKIATNPILLKQTPVLKNSFTVAWRMYRIFTKGQKQSQNGQNRARNGKSVKKTKSKSTKVKVNPVKVKGQSRSRKQRNT
ncbi:hypothetical protein Tco_0024602 [Tanacetum coccineum]